jgi:hypothetical protein
MQPGGVVETVMVGPPIGGCVRLWDAENRHSLWTVDEPERMASELGRGRISRTGVEPSRFREVGLLDPDAATLLLPARTRRNDRDDPRRIELRGSVYRLRPVPGPQPPRAADPWDELAQWLGDVFLDAASRAEFVVIEMGGWDAPQTPYVLAILTHRDGDARWLMECAPRPGPPSLWEIAGASSPDGATVSASATPDTIRAGGRFAVDAAARWASSPHDLGLTFGVAPASPSGAAGTTAGSPGNR